jgi:hypothetical protein
MIKLNKKAKICFICLIILCSSFSASAQSFDTFIGSELENLSFKKEISVPIDTSLAESKFQAIDLKVEFNNPCWAVDEIKNSVRVGFEKAGIVTELESQIYDLERIDDTHISSCSLVFLIPEEANGQGKYFVFYESEEVAQANYPDHILLEDESYFYEPISGQKIFFDYYGIIEDDFVIYAIIQKGELLGNPVGLNVAKLKPNSVEVETNNIDQLAGFDFRYGITKSPGYVGSSWATEIYKEILVDGNLMIRVRIEGTSPSGTVKTDNIYTYYYCPGQNKKIIVNTNHEVLKDVQIEDPELYDGGYAGIVSIKSRSATIEKMNVGDILPQICLYSENENIDCYNVPQNPDSDIKQAILSTEEDIDLGSKGWISLLDSETGKAHGLIIDRTKGLVSGDLDGVQAKAWVKQNLKLPGLEADTGSVFIFRNNYEKDKGHTTEIKSGFKVNYNIEFFTTDNEGSERIDKESEIFQNLVKLMPLARENKTIDEETIQKFNLKTFVHFAPSVPLGALFTAASGKEFSYIYAEIFKENDLRSSGAVARISLLGSIELDLEGKNILQILKSLIGLFDWRNASLFKKIIFPDLEAGTYVIKIFRENPITAENRQFIGYKIVEIPEDKTVHIFCKSEGSLNLDVVDQDQNPIENVKFQLLIDDEIISNSLSDKNGSAILFVPISPLKPYRLIAIYKGFLISEKELRFRLFNRFVNLKQSYEINTYDLYLKITDNWNLPVAVDVNPRLTSEDMIKENFIQSEKIKDGEYKFSNLISADYILSISYKSFEVNKKINIDKSTSLSQNFPAQYTCVINLKDSLSNNLSAGTVTVSRQGQIKNININEEGKANIDLPPANYILTIKEKDKTIAKQEIQINSEKSLEIITTQDSIFHQILQIIGLLIILVALILLIIKRKVFACLKLIVIGLILISLFTPWWTLYGNESGVNTSTKALLIPSKIITITESDDAIGGEIALVPDDVTMVLSLISYILIISIILLIFSIFSKNRLRKTTYLFSILSAILIVICLSIFYYAFSLITEVGVGSFIGEGSIDTTIPGISENILINSSWGPGIGFYLGIISIVLIIACVIYYKRKSKTFFFKSTKAIGSYKVKPYSKHRRSIEVITHEGWKKRSTHTILELDVTNALSKIKKLKKQGKDVSFTSYMIKCVAQGLSKHKELNSLRSGRKKIFIFDDVDVAVPIERNINGEARPLVILIRKANEKDVFEITKEIRKAQNQAVGESSRIISTKISALEKFALVAPTFLQKFLIWVTKKNAKLKKKYMGTTGVTAIGMKGAFPGGVIPLGGTATTLFVVGGIVKKPAVVNDKIKVRSILNLTLTTDHDLVDGGPLVRFIEGLTKSIEKGLYL